MLCQEGFLSLCFVVYICIPPLPNPAPQSLAKAEELEMYPLKPASDDWCTACERNFSQIFWPLSKDGGVEDRGRGWWTKEGRMGWRKVKTGQLMTVTKVFEAQVYWASQCRAQAYLLLQFSQLLADVLSSLGVGSNYPISFLSWALCWWIKASCKGVPENIPTLLKVKQPWQVSKLTTLVV